MAEWLDEINALSEMNYCDRCNFYFGKRDDDNKICPECGKNINLKPVEQNELK